MLEWYFDVEDFWRQTGLTSATCDACGASIPRGQGWLLTSEEITKSPWYTERCIPRAVDDAARDLEVGLQPEEAQFVQGVTLLLARGSRTQWLVCEECGRRIAG